MIILSIFNHDAILLMLCIVIVMLTAIIGTSPQLFRNSNRGLGVGSISLLTLFSSIYAIQSADFVYFTYALQTGIGISHFEEFYIDLWDYNRDILFYRFTIFGGSILLLMITMKMIEPNMKFACFIFVITQMFYFGQMRNMFGFMVMFFSIASLYRYGDLKHHFIGLIICIAGFWCSTFLHRSMFMYLILLIPSLIPFGKKTILASAIAFPFAYGAISMLSSWFIGTFGSEEIQQISIYYSEEHRETTVFQTIRDILLHISYIYLLYIILKTYVNKGFDFPPIMSFLSRYAYILMYIGFLFCGQSTGGWLFVRFAGAGELALMFVMMWFFYFYPRTRGVKLAFSGLILFIILQILYIYIRAFDGFSSRFNMIEI